MYNTAAALDTNSFFSSSPGEHPVASRLLPLQPKPVANRDDAPRPKLGASDSVRHASIHGKAGHDEGGAG